MLARVGVLVPAAHAFSARHEGQEAIVQAPHIAPAAREQLELVGEALAVRERAEQLYEVQIRAGRRLSLVHFRLEDRDRRIAIARVLTASSSVCPSSAKAGLRLAIPLR